MLSEDLICLFVWLLSTALCVTIHVEALVYMHKLDRSPKSSGRQMLYRNLYILLIAHFLQINIFALAFEFLHWMSIGGFVGMPVDAKYTEYLYYSAVAYTTIGFGDVIPLGLMRAVTAASALTGLILIAVSATYLVISFEKYIKGRTRPEAL